MSGNNKIDKKDQILLKALNTNARTSQTQLAKKTRLSKPSITYRIARLEESGIIRRFSAVINLGALDLTTFTLLLKFNTDIAEHPEIADYFLKHPYCGWTATLSGQWDLFVEMIALDFSHFSDMIHALVDHFGSQLYSYETFFSRDTLRVEHLPGSFGSKTKTVPSSSKRQTIPQPIDHIDRIILHAFTKNSSASVLALARDCGVTSDIVRYRLMQLRKKGIIVKSFADVNLQKLGYTEYLFRLKLRNTTKEQMTKLKNMISVHDQVTYAFADIARFSLLFVCAFENTGDIDHLSRMLRKNFGDIILEQEYLLIKDQPKFDLFPAGLLIEHQKK